MNDSNYLYIALITTNREVQRQVMRGGTTIWLDRDGGDDRKFGIHYPLGQNQQPEDQRETYQRSDNDLEILGPGDEHHRMTIAETGGIDVRFELSNDTLVYEMKIPLPDDG